MHKGFLHRVDLIGAYEHLRRLGGKLRAGPAP